MSISPTLPEILSSKDRAALKASLESRKALLPELQNAAREITLPLFSTGMKVSNKGKNGFDPVTQADIEAEKALRRIIKTAFPTDSISGEEFPDIDGMSGWLWTVDPIDGTRGFVAGVPVWSTLIALSYENRPLLGLADFPALKTCFIGGQDGTFRIDGTLGESTKTPISTRRCESLDKAILGCTEPFSMFRPGELAAYNMVRSGVRFTRLGLDSLGYCLLASGRMDIILEAGLKACDIRALIPILEGAGGAVTDWHGALPVNGGRVVAVGNAALLPELYTYLGRAITD